uniref:Uncharacterized protein n=1 Tax=Candidatus Kentrum eta TaxID=2126337 RepID=A0A450VVD4_9GAMM|nr:MAG: hypothetical protein BECKH772B_GA0070898_105332 [Candidatus Kentron sp. H]VFK08768.1 MAG: hypothetical protein BECKH772C_GA0070978_105452 [Candidatus Kentron sp. H]
MSKKTQALLSKQPWRRGMALSETAFTQISRGQATGIEHAAGNKCDFIRVNNRVSVATAAAGISALECGLLLFLQMVAGRYLEKSP